MTNTLFSYALGGFINGLLAVFFLLWAVPLTAGILIALGRLRYREWLACLAFLTSALSLLFCGDFLYNLGRWSSVRAAAPENFLSCFLLFATPLFWSFLVFARSRRKLLWGAGLSILFTPVYFQVMGEFEKRKTGDLEVVRREAALLGPREGTLFAQTMRDWHGDSRKLYLFGHVAPASTVTLLTSPYSGASGPLFCTARTSSYLPPVPDPAVFGNATELTELRNCQKNTEYGLAYLGPAVAEYKYLPFHPFKAAPDPGLLSRPLVSEGLKKYGYAPSDFDLKRTAFLKASGPRGRTLFLTGLKPVKFPQKARPCEGPAQIVSVGSPGNAKAVLPYCSMDWVLFRLNNELYFSAVTEAPTYPGTEMCPDSARWLFGVENGELKQIWPVPQTK